MTARADDEGRSHEPGGRTRVGRSDHEVAREALMSGKVRPLEQVLAEVRVSTPGDIVGIELERKRGRLVYKIKVITPKGTLRKLMIDARAVQSQAGSATVPGSGAASAAATPDIAPQSLPSGARSGSAPDIPARPSQAQPSPTATGRR